MNKRLLTLVLSAALSTTAHASERRLDIEAALVAHDAARAPGNALIGLGVAGFVVATVCGVWAASLVAEDSARFALGLAIVPLTGRAPSTNSNPMIEPLFGAAIGSGIAGATSLLAGLIMRQAMAPASERQELLLERARLEGERRAAARLRLLPQLDETPPPPAVAAPVDPGPRRVPLRPR